MNPYLIIAALLSVLSAGWGGFRLGVDHEKAAQVDKLVLVAEAVDAANGAAAGAIAKLIPKNTTIRQVLEKEIRENNIYHDCKSSDDSVRAFNSAIEPQANPAGGLKLPGTNPSRGRVVGVMDSEGAGDRGAVRPVPHGSTSQVIDKL